MRLDQLDIRAYGALTGLTLDFRASGLHLVYGRNEAGKSTTRRAIGDVLYGPAKQGGATAVAARHPVVGALITDRDGRSLSFRRTINARTRKLTDLNGQPLSDDVLIPFLDGIDRATFLGEFALHAEELRKGGALLVEGNGDLTQALTATRSGMRMTEALKKLSAQSAALYVPRGKNPPINARMRELQETQRRLNEATLRPARYTEAEREQKQADKELQTTRESLADAQRALTELTELRQALPQLRKRRELHRALGEIDAEGPVAPVDVAERLPGLLAEQRAGQARIDELTVRHADLARDLDSLRPDQRLLTEWHTIEELSDARKAMVEAERRMHDLRAQAARLTEDATGKLREVHPEATLDDTRLYRLPNSSIVTASELRDEYLRISGELGRAREKVETELRRREEADKELADLPVQDEPGVLRAALQVVPSGLIDKIISTEEVVTTTQSRIDALRGELRIDDPDLVEAARTSVPPRAEATELEAHSTELRTLEWRLRDTRHKTDEELGEARSELRELLAVGAPPTRAELENARVRRTALWQRIREGEGTDLVGEFEEALADADAIADRMFEHVERTTKRQQLEQQISRLETRAAGHADRARELEAERSELKAAWTALWSGYPGRVPTFAATAAAEVFDRVDRLRDEAEKLREAHGSRTALMEQARQHVDRLSELIRDSAATGEMVRLNGDSVLAALPELQEVAQQRINEYDGVDSRRGILQDRVDTASQAHDFAVAEVSSLEAALADWSERWELLLTQAELPLDSTPDTALTNLTRLAEVASTARSAEEATRSADGDEQRTNAYRERVTITAAACGIEPPTTAERFHQVVGELRTAAQQHRSDHERREQLRVEHNALVGDLKQVTTALERGADELARFAERTGLPVDALPEAVDRRARRNDTQTLLRGVEEGLPEGPALDALLDRESTTDPTTLDLEITDLEAAIGRLQSSYEEQAKTLALREREFQELDGSADAASAGADAAMLAADLVADTEEYLKLELAAAYLRTCMDHYRQADDDPLLDRASGYFHSITEGRYAGLVLDADTDVPTIRAKQPDGAIVAVTDLSEGTCDQVYFALRLATLERHADEHRALPLIIDDIFMTFDDLRTRAALSVLATVSDRFQVIVFTHHTRVLEAARTALPADRLHLHELPTPTRNLSNRMRHQLA